jgi:Fe-S oxidoreductase
MVSNQRRAGNPLGLDQSKLTSWSRGLTFDGSSGAYLYTGGLYQMAPYIDSFVGALDRLEGGRGGSALMGLVGALGRLGVNVSSIYSSITSKDTSRYDNIIRRLHGLLLRQGLTLGYLGADEPYSGVIFYDLGFDSEFTVVAEKCARTLRDKGVKKLVTVDPHSTVVLRDVYPKYVDGFDVEVTHYLDVVDADRVRRSHHGVQVFAVHDPCLLARNLGLSDKYRALAENTGAKIVVPPQSGRMTHCCGGPIENIAPRVSGAIAETRCRQLGSLSDNVLVGCPLCLGNLGRACSKVGSARGNVFDVLEVVE